MKGLKYKIPDGFKGTLKSLGLNPTDIVIYVNSKCNLRCKHCYIGNELLNSKNTVDPTSVNNFLNEVNDIDRVTILGGEPLLHPQITEVLLNINRLSIREKRITTNLTYLSENALSILSKSDIRTCVSIDGHNELLHDQIRGAGNFKRTITNLKKLIAANCDIEVTHTVNAKNIDFLVEFISFLKNIGVRKVNLHRISMKGNAFNNSDLYVSPSKWRFLTDNVLPKISTSDSNDSITLRYEVGFMSDSELRSLITSGKYKNHALGSFYSSKGHRIVFYPDGKVYISSEAFDTDSYIGSIVNGVFVFNDSYNNELLLSSRGFISFRDNIDEKFEETVFPNRLSVSFRKTIAVS